MALKLATTTWDQSEYDALKRVIDSGIFTMGKEVSKFEEQFASYFNTRYAVMVNSGSSANLLMVAALFFIKKNKLQPGDEVIVPAVSWSTTYTPLQQYGLKLVFVDIDQKTLNMDIKAVKRAISPETKAIFAVNLLGNPCDLDELHKISNKYKIHLIEDNCESMGAKLDGKYCGTYGSMGSFSTFFSHHISTMEGGLIVTDDEELYHILICLRAHGWTRNLPDLNHVSGKKSKIEFEEAFKFILPGYNVRPLEMSGALGQEQLKKLNSIISGRRSNAQKFHQLFKNNENITIQKENSFSSHFGFSIIFQNKETRNELIKIFDSNDIEVRPIVAGNFLDNEVVKYCNYRVQDELINAKIVNDCGLFIGNHHFDISKELDQVKSIVDAFL